MQLGFRAAAPRLLPVALALAVMATMLAAPSSGVASEPEGPAWGFGAASTSEDCTLPFEDVHPDSVHADKICRLVEAGITTGVDDSNYGPDRSVTRAQMATFLTRALDLPTRQGSDFDDVDPGGVHAPAINAILDAEITAGRADGTFGPNDVVTREQMATFMARAISLDGIDGDAFEDVHPENVHRENIYAVLDAGITQGVSDSSFAPSDAVARDQMASFLIRKIDFVDERSPGNGDDETPPDTGDGTLEDLQESGATLGIANDVPFGYEVDGEPVGLGPDVAATVLAELDVEIVDFEVVAFGDLLPGLRDGQFDIVSAGLIITPDRAQQAWFSHPDYCSLAAIAVAEGNPFDLEDHESIAANPEVTVGALSGTVQLDWLENAGVDAGQIEIFGHHTDMFAALEDGVVDAVTGVPGSLIEQASNLDVEVLPEFVPVDDDGSDLFMCGGHAFADEGVRDAFNDVLDPLRADGTTSDIITEYFITEVEVETANELTLDDLIG